MFRLPGQPKTSFGLDFVNEKSEPQAIGERITIIVGPRMPDGPEQEGDIALSMDDMGVEDPSHYTNLTRYGVTGGGEYKFVYEGVEKKTYSFPGNLLEDAAPQSSTA